MEMGPDDDFERIQSATQRSCLAADKESNENKRRSEKLREEALKLLKPFHLVSSMRHSSLEAGTMPQDQL